MKVFCHHQKFFLLKTTFKLSFEFLFNVFILINTFSYLKINLKLIIDSKMRTFKNLEKLVKPGNFLNKQVATLLVSK